MDHEREDAAPRTLHHSGERPGQWQVSVALDEYGNAKGGVRNVWIDVPTAVYGVLAKGKTQAANFLCQIAGTKVRLPEPILKKLYKNKEDYAARVDRRLSELVSQGWFLPEYVETVHNEVKAAEIP